MLIGGFRSRFPVRVFPEGWESRARRFEPESIAGTPAQIDALALEQIAVTHSIVVLERRGERITAADRERWWKAFEAPLFEQIIGEDGELLAFECEAHDGLHVASAKFEVSREELDVSVCGCGRTSPRVISPIRRIAAYAR